MNQNQFLLDSGFWGWLYKLLYPVEWLMTQIMAVFHKFLVMLGMNEIGFSWVMSIVFLVLVVQACVFPLFYKSMKGMRKMQAQMTVLQPKMQRIQNKYKGKNDPASKEAMQREMMKLYQDNDANPMGGCTSMLPMFVQGPVFMCMFYTLSAIPYIARGKFRDGQGLGAFDELALAVRLAFREHGAQPAQRLVVQFFHRAGRRAQPFRRFRQPLHRERQCPAAPAVPDVSGQRAKNAARRAEHRRIQHRHGRQAGEDEHSGENRRGPGDIQRGAAMRPDIGKQDLPLVLFHPHPPPQGGPKAPALIQIGRAHV